ncbi:MAG: tail fiber domain-containing protein [Thermoplasmatota archaeon]
MNRSLALVVPLLLIAAAFTTAADTPPAADEAAVVTIEETPTTTIITIPTGVCPPAGGCDSTNLPMFTDEMGDTMFGNLGMKQRSGLYLLRGGSGGGGVSFSNAEGGVAADSTDGPGPSGMIVWGAPAAGFDIMDPGLQGGTSWISADAGLMSMPMSLSDVWTFEQGGRIVIADGSDITIEDGGDIIHSGGDAVIQTAEDFIVEVAGKTALRVEDTNTFVGVNTDSPGDALDVNGTIIPHLDATYALGRADKRFTDLYLDSVIHHKGTLYFEGTNEAPQTTMTLGTDGDVWFLGDVEADGLNVGFSNTRGYLASVAGGRSNEALGFYSVVAGGDDNDAHGKASAVAGGETNDALAQYSFVGGGQTNQAVGSHSTIGGGFENDAADDYVAVGGGRNNYASGLESVIAGGDGNTAGGGNSAIGGGGANLASGLYATIGGGYLNQATHEYATVAGGWDNEADGARSTVGGGELNRADYLYATVAGGGINHAGDQLATVGGGRGNSATDYAATVAGGDGNTAGAHASVVAGGQYNDINSGSSYSFVGGGQNNDITGAAYAVIGGGYWNDANGAMSVVAGGRDNVVSGGYATVPGGRDNLAAGSYSFAAGDQAKANHAGSFVWADWSDVDLSSEADNQFLARATGGVKFLTSTGGAGAELPSGSGSWSSLSDVNFKQDLEAVDARAVLEALAAMPVQEWSYVTEDGVRHMGPTAQDFAAAFGLGPSETSISTVDADGVNMAAIQGLYGIVLEQQAKIEALEAGQGADGEPTTASQPAAASAPVPVAGGVSLVAVGLIALLASLVGVVGGAWMVRRIAKSD